jgi:hypothetical protein
MKTRSLSPSGERAGERGVKEKMQVIRFDGLPLSQTLSPEGERAFR